MFDSHVPLEQYIAVLENEVSILEKNYFNQYIGGTGHFNTAISVLKFRIEELKKEFLSATI